MCFGFFGGVLFGWLFFLWFWGGCLFVCLGDCLLVFGGVQLLGVFLGGGFCLVELWGGGGIGGFSLVSWVWFCFLSWCTAGPCPGKKLKVGHVLVAAVEAMAGPFPASHLVPASPLGPDSKPHPD